jgi:hypothetical protein
MFCYRYRFSALFGTVFIYFFHVKNSWGIFLAFLLGQVLCSFLQHVESFLGELGSDTPMALIRQLSPKLECSREGDNAPTLEVAPPATAEQVSMLIAALSGRTEIEQESAPEIAADPPRIEQVLSEDERRVLFAARERLRVSTNSSE